MFDRDKRSAYDAQYEAQKLAFAPVAFQVARICRDWGLLQALMDAGEAGLTHGEVAEAIERDDYAVTVLLEGAIASELAYLVDERFKLTKVGYYVLTDKMTRVNMDFTHDVCYEGIFRLERALDEGKPAGLEVFGNWTTIYQALAELPEPVRKSWFGFDHFYSDGAFPEALRVIQERGVKRMLDIGGNTGNWSRYCCEQDPAIQITIADLPGQLKEALATAKELGLEGRIRGHEADLLDSALPLPTGFDAVWMSQFLCCFSEAEVLSILHRAKAAVGPEGRLYILDTCWDRQRFETAAYCVIMTSPYFASLANGNSRMYSARDFIRLFEASGLSVESEHDGLGLSHTLFCCKVD